MWIGLFLLIFQFFLALLLVDCASFTLVPHLHTNIGFQISNHLAQSYIGRKGIQLYKLIYKRQKNTELDGGLLSWLSAC